MVFIFAKKSLKQPTWENKYPVGLPVSHFRVQCCFPLDGRWERHHVLSDHGPEGLNLVLFTMGRGGGALILGITCETFGGHSVHAGWSCREMSTQGNWQLLCPFCKLGCTPILGWHTFSGII